MNSSKYAYTKKADREDRSFGVKSYHYHFYDSLSKEALEKPPDENIIYLYELPREVKMNSVWFRLIIWLSIDLLLTGIIALLIGLLLKQRKVIIDTSDSISILDKDALSYNQNLDMCKIAGVALMLLGVLVMLAALMFPVRWMQRLSKIQKQKTVRKNTVELHRRENIPLNTTVKMVQPVNDDVLKKSTIECTKK